MDSLHKIKIFQKKVTIDDSKFSSGIDEECIENPGDLEEILKGYTCCICLEIVKLPMECKNCESLYCSDCWQLLKTQGKNCVLSCDKIHVHKARRFVRNLLSNLYVKCSQCNVRTDYLTFIAHTETCAINLKFFSRNEFKKIIDDQDEKINSLKKELETLKEARNEEKKKQDALKKEQLKTKIANDPEMKKIREEMLKNILDVHAKSKFQKAIIEGKYIDFTHMALNGYPILEEISPPNYYWTALHYTMYYGQLDMAEFCISTLEKEGILDKAMVIFSSDGRCPILCLLTNSMTLEQKKSFLSEILINHPKIKISDYAKVEIKKRGMANLLKIYCGIDI